MVSISALLILIALLLVILAATGQLPLWPAVLCVVLERVLSIRPLFVLAAIVLLPAQASAQSPLLERAVDLANGAALVAHAAEYGSTVRCVSARTCVEGNKWVAPFVHGDSPDQVKYFAVKWGTALASYYVKTRTKHRYPWPTLAIAGAEAAAFFVIADHNRDVHNRAQRK